VVADLSFIDETLYALEAGCSHRLKNTVNGVLRVDRDGHTSQVADLSAVRDPTSRPAEPVGP